MIPSAPNQSISVKNLFHNPRNALSRAFFDVGDMKLVQQSSTGVVVFKLSAMEFLYVLNGAVITIRMRRKAADRDKIIHDLLTGITPVCQAVYDHLLAAGHTPMSDRRTIAQ